MLRALGPLAELAGPDANLDIVDLFTYPTVAGLAQRIGAASGSAGPQPAPDLAASQSQDRAARQRAARQLQRNKHLKDKNDSTT
jgi:hypothetical protein